MNQPILLNRLLVLGLSLATVTYATVIPFGSVTEYQSNFVETVNGGNTLYDAIGGTLVKTTDNAATGLVFNPNDNAAAGLNRASAFYDNPRALVGGAGSVTFTADFQFSNGNNGNSMGFYVKMPDATEQTTPAGAYAILFRTNTGGGEVRFWDYSTNNNIGTAGVNGSSVVTKTFDGGSLASGTWYTAQVEMQDVAGEVVFTTSLFYTGDCAVVC